MSIFKDTFKQGIQDQIKARQKAISARNSSSIQYFNSRNAWIRMSSAVNVNGTDELAKKYILQGGVLLDGKLRSGIGKTGNEAYSISSPGGTSHRLGIRPMPGITGVDVKSRSAYGSLREVTVNFIAWDLRQLEDLELLYMRPNYSVLIEWGWAPYLDNSGNLQNRINFYPDFFKSGKTKEEIWAEIYDKASTDGNYDALYGFVKNYSWSARPDGGYDCVTTIISMGEILESLKVNYNAFDNESLSKNVGIFNTPFYATSEELRVSQGGASQGTSNTVTTTTTNQYLIDSYAQNIIAGICAELRYKLLPTASTQQDGPVLIPDPKDKSITYNFLKFSFDVKSEDNKSVISRSQAYVTLDSFLKILNKHVLLQGTNDQGVGKPIVSFSTKGRDGKDLLCLGNIFQISTNPTVCFIINKVWEKPQDTLGIVTKGNLSKIQELLGKENVQNYFFENDYVDKQLGVIGNIYLNLDYLFELATNNNLASQDKKEKNDISVFDYLKNVMSGVNTAIGNLANFDIHVDPLDSTARIIDVNYVDTTPRDEAYDNAFEFEMQKVGPVSGSIVRNYRLESQIFPEMSTIVAIGAQVQGGALGSNANTLIDFNQNLTDRIIPRKEAPYSINNPSNSTEEFITKASALAANIKLITKYITDLTPSWYEGVGNYDIQEASKYANALRDIINFYNSYTNVDTKNRGIIPTKLSLEVDGVGGIVIGNLFRIPDEILPKGYKGGQATGSIGTKIAYTVTSLGHTIQSNDWVTKIDSQFIILDNPKGKITTERFIEILKNVNIAASTGSVSQISSALFGGGNIAIVPDTSSIADRELDKITQKYPNNQGIPTEVVAIDGKPVGINLAKAVLLMKKEASAAGINLRVNSGFRSPTTFIGTKSSKGVTVSADSQSKLSQTAGGFAAPAFRSKHGDSLAIDFNTGTLVPSTANKTPINRPLYQWLIDNAYKFGFVRTVSSEEWHWEYKPGSKQYDFVPRNHPTYNGMNIPI